MIKEAELNLSALEILLGKDNVEDVRKGIVNLIIDRVEKDIESYDYYLFCPDDYQSTIAKAFEKIEKRLVKMYSDAALESAQEAVKRFKDISAAMFDDNPGLKLRSCHKCKYCNGNRCTFYEDKKYYWTAHDSICAEEGFINYVEKK